MPLITLRTNLRDIKFGRDRLNGGSSNQPYIQTPIDDGSTTPEPFKSFFNANKTTYDFPVRGGGLLEQLSTGFGSSTIAAQIDRDRIEKFLKDGERGPNFIRKQVGLQLSNPKMQTSEVNPNFRISDFPGLIQNTRIYNLGRNTLTSVQYAGTGVFLNRAGALPFNPRDKYYKDIMREEFLLDDNEIENVNRLLILRRLKLSSIASDPISTVNDFSIINKLGISTNRTRLFDYLGGPGSVYGVGATVIKRAYDTSEAVNKNITYQGSQIQINRLTYTYDNLLSKSSRSSSNTDKSIITSYSDFRDDITNYAGKKLSGSYSADSVERRFTNGSRVDKINILPVVKFDRQDYPADSTNAKNVNDELVSDLKSQSDDLVKFVFECISNDGQLDDAIFFRAHLGNITDNHKANWNGFKYMGRGENFYTYQGVDRTFSTSFKIAIGAYEELKIVYDKLNYLISQVYPDYNLNTQFMRAPLMRLTIGDYLYRATGYLENVDISFDDKSSWDITDGRQLPHYINVNFGYKIIEKKLPQRGKAGINFVKFMGEPLYNADNTLK